MTTRALLSVWDKTGLEAFARGLVQLKWQLIASGNTSKSLTEWGIEHRQVSDVTGSPEMLDGRVKTLHPRIHGGILADRRKQSHLDDLAANDIEPIDLVVCNLYPFRSDPSVELIDIGGPTMVRAAAKNFENVGVVVDPADYGAVLDELRREGSLSDDSRRRLARAAFAHTAAYDAAIVGWLDGDELLPPTLHFALEKVDEPLRYGENPHQAAARYRAIGDTSWWDSIEQHAGMKLSYLNLYDTEAAWRLVWDLSGDDEPACAIIKHANPSGAAVASSLASAYDLALAADERSAFGGIVAFNGPVTSAVCDRVVEGPQADVIIAPAYEGDSIERLIAKRKATRLLQAVPPGDEVRHYRQISGGFLVQQPHHFAASRKDWRVATKVEPTPEQWRDAELAWRITGHVKSNSIVLVNGGAAVGIGAGQQSRVDSAEIAAKKAGERARGGACASDAFYPFPDGVEAAIAAGCSVIIQPGGSLRDDDAIAVADAAGVAMILTGERHFVH